MKNTKKTEALINAILAAQEEYDTKAAPIILKWENILNQGVGIYVKEMENNGNSGGAQEAVGFITYPAINEYWLGTAKLWDKYLAAKEKWGWDGANIYWEVSRKIDRPND